MTDKFPRWGIWVHYLSGYDGWKRNPHELNDKGQISKLDTGHVTFATKEEAERYIAEEDTGRAYREAREYVGWGVQDIVQKGTP